MNELPSDGALRDRLYTINVPSYSLSDKVQILKNFIFPKFLKNINLKNEDIIITEDICKYIINRLGDESGIRSLEKCVKDMLNKIDFIVKNQENRKEFDFMSFNTDIELHYPLTLNEYHINQFFKENCVNISRNSMYI